MPDTHVTITGNLTEDPELRYTPNGAPVANLRVAVTPRVKDGDGWKDGETSFFQVTAWRTLAENVAESLTKGAGSWSTAGCSSARGRRPRASGAASSRSRSRTSAPRCGGPPPSPERVNAKAATSASNGGQFNDEPPF